MTPAPLPAFLNKKCGNASAAREVLAGESFTLNEVDPDKLVDHFRDAVAKRAPRILVAGGDGTIAAAAAVVARTETQLAVLPGGTLNHFAKDNGIPTDLNEAGKVAAGDVVAKVDLGYLGDRVFLNTSSIGLYVKFVRVREKLEQNLGYRIASLLAALRMFSGLRMMAVKLEVEGRESIYRTPLVFIGVGERELQLPTLGARIKNGRHGLHVMVVRGRRPARLFALALAAVSRGTKELSQTPHFDSFIVDKCSIDLNQPSALVALDGELHRMSTPLEYRIEREALSLVVAAPEEDTGEKGSAG